MAYCRKCGARIDDEAVVCPFCGVMQRGGGKPAPAPADRGGFGWGLLGFCVPIVGLILYLVWREERPRTSKAAGTGALISVLSIIGLYVFIFVFGLGMALISL